MDHILSGEYDDEIRDWNIDEVADVKWMKMAEFRDHIKSHPECTFSEYHAICS